MTIFTQVYLRPKMFLLGSSLAFSLKEDPVRCAKVCNKSWVILYTVYVQENKFKISQRFKPVFYQRYNFFFIHQTFHKQNSQIKAMSN